MSINLISFKKIIDQYRVVFFDAFGVLRTSGQTFPGTYDVLQNLKAKEKAFFIISNDASEPPLNIARKYSSSNSKHRILISQEQIITSGMLALNYLQTQCKGKNVTYLGPEESAYYVETSGNPNKPIMKIPDLSWPDVCMFLDDTGYDWYDALNRLVNIVRKKKDILLLAPNPDLLYPAKDGVMIATGGLAKLIELVTNRDFINFGKPSFGIFNFAFEKAKNVFSDLKKSEILMVGDTLATDIKGAQDFGIDSLLVFSGNISKSEYEAHHADLVIRPTYCAESIMT